MFTAFTSLQVISFRLAILFPLVVAELFILTVGTDLITTTTIDANLQKLIHKICFLSLKHVQDLDESMSPCDLCKSMAISARLHSQLCFESQSGGAIDEPLLGSSYHSFFRRICHERPVTTWRLIR